MHSTLPFKEEAPKGSGVYSQLRHPTSSPRFLLSQLELLTYNPGI